MRGIHSTAAPLPTEKQIRVAAKLYEGRDTVRSLLGARYKERMAEYATVIQAVAHARMTNELKAAQDIVREANFQGSLALVVLAAAVELVEPSA